MTAFGVTLILQRDQPTSATPPRVTTEPPRPATAAPTPTPARSDADADGSAHAGPRFPPTRTRTPTRTARPTADAAPECHPHPADAADPASADPGPQPALRPADRVVGLRPAAPPAAHRPARRRALPERDDAVPVGDVPRAARGRGVPADHTAGARLLRHRGDAVRSGPARLPDLLLPGQPDHLLLGRLDRGVRRDGPAGRLLDRLPRVRASRTAADRRARRRVHPGRGPAPDQPPDRAAGGLLHGHDGDRDAHDPAERERPRRDGGLAQGGAGRDPGKSASQLYWINRGFGTDDFGRCSTWTATKHLG